MTDGNFAICELTNLSKSCIMHALAVLVDDDQPSSLDRIKKFCKELLLVQPIGSTPRRRASTKQDTPDVELQPTFDLEIIKSFLKGEKSAKQLQEVIERELIRCTNGNFDDYAMFSLCWKVYRERQRPDSTAEVFSKQHPPEKDDCMYYLWLIFNAIISPEEKAMVMPVKCLDAIMKRLCELCGHECSSEELIYSTARDNLDYPGYLKAIANYCEKFNLKSSLTCEVVEDLKDEIVDGVLKKSYLMKKGHVRKNWRRRWFVLRKTVMTYYESKAKPVIKGQMVLNDNTDIKEMSAQGKKTYQYCFEVVCGKTQKVFKISADDEKSRHEWIFAITKAIDLARILAGGKVEEVPKFECDDNPHFTANFYLISFRSLHSIIPKWEGGVKTILGAEDFSEDEDEQSDDEPAPSQSESKASTVASDSFIRKNTGSTRRRYDWYEDRRPRRDYIRRHRADSEGEESTGRKGSNPEAGKAPDEQDTPTSIIAIVTDSNKPAMETNCTLNEIQNEIVFPERTMSDVSMTEESRAKPNQN